MRRCLVRRLLLLAALCQLIVFTPILRSQEQTNRHAVPQEHPRLFGTRERLQALAIERPEAYARMKAVTDNPDATDHELMFSLALVTAIERDSTLGRRAVELAMTYVNGPIRSGHVTFGYDLARCAVVYDLCWEYWTADERAKFHTYVNATVDANVTSEASPFHNGWYGYKHWGYGLAAYATWDENPRARTILQKLEDDYRTLAAPALSLAGNGGGWAEGYYGNYWTYEWMVFCEAARFCEGVDYCGIASDFFGQRAIASMFEAYPGIREYGSRRPIPMGDGGGRLFGGDRDKVLCVRRMLASLYRDDPAHQAVHAFNETTPRVSVGTYAYKDFLWRDTSVPKGELETFKLSHLSQGPGYVYARSSWREDATSFFFKCGDRFTSHQHLDVGHFMIAKYEELLGDGGHYDEFGTSHDVNYHLRTIAHNTMLVYNSREEIRPDIRAGMVLGNDGGQSYPQAPASHNWAANQVSDWNSGKSGYDIATLLSYRDGGDWLYLAGDCSRAYAANKLEHFYRQIVYLRPDRFVIFDRVKSKSAGYRKTFLLQAMKVPEVEGQQLRITNGEGRLFVRTVLPERAAIVLNSGAGLYTYGGRNYPPSWDTGPAPECRVEISPFLPAIEDLFLLVMEAGGSGKQAMCEVTRITGPAGEEGVRLTPAGEPQVEIMFADTGAVAATLRIGEGEPISLAAGIDPSVPERTLRGDINGDRRRNLLDVLSLLLAIHRGPADPALDFDSDGAVTVADVVALIRYIHENRY